MTEPFDLSPAGAADAAAGESHSTATDSFGAMLRRAREARGWSAREVGARMQLRERLVTALEDEDFAALPQSAFVRGFARKYASLVGVDTNTLMAALDRRLTPDRPLQLGDGSAMNPVQLAAREQFSRIAVVGGALISLAIFAVVGWLSMRPVETPPAAATAKASADRVAVPGSVTTAAVNESGVVGSGPSAANPAAGSAARGDAPVQGTAVASQAAVAVPATALRFDFRERTWVEIVQADGKVLMSQINEAGTRQIVDGRPPYVVVIGNVRGVHLEYRGENVALEPLTSRDNVARLRLN